MPGRRHFIVKNLVLPREFTSIDIQPKNEIVIARVDNETIINRNNSVITSIPSNVVINVVRESPSLLPLEVNRKRVNRFDHVARLRHIENSVVGQRRTFLSARRQRS